MFGKKKMYELECRIEELARKNENLTLHLKAMEDVAKRTGDKMEMFDKALCKFSKSLDEINERIIGSVNSTKERLTSIDTSGIEKAIDEFKNRLLSIEDDVNHLVANASKTTKKATKKSDA